ncbi:MAG: OmpA family protein [Ekhidna sp.]
MQKFSIAAILLLSICSLAATAQTTEDTFVLVSGRVLKAADSTALSARLLYEKLPYYDDMGMANTSADGSFSVQLIQGKSYIFSVKKDGWKPFSQEIEITGESSFDFYVKEDVVELRKLENLNFASGSYKISSSSFGELNELAQWLDENPTIVVQLEGHTDFDGNADAQMGLSEARVIAVKEYLTKQGVKKNRILTKAFGGTQPLTQERTAEGKTRNRRVEVRVMRR